MSQTTTPAAPTRAQFKPFREVRTIGEALKHPDMIERFKLATPKHLSPERMLRVCSMAVQKTPKLAECDLMSLLGAMLSLVSLGLEPNTPLGHAYLIPFEKRAQVDGKWQTVAVEVQVVVGYRGYIDLARRSGSLVAIHADVIYEGDEFSFSYGSDMHLRHKPALDRKDHKPLWAYFYCKLTDGEAFEVLPYKEVLKIRDNSEGYKSALRTKERSPTSWQKNPWVAFEHEMVAKTLIRRINKRLPMTIEMANAAALDAMSEVGKVDFRSIATAPVSEMMDTRELTYDEYVPAMDIPMEGQEEPEEDRVETKREESKPQQQRQADPPKPAAPQPQPAKPSSPPAPQAVYYLLDAEGNPVDGGNYSDAVAYARALASYLMAAFPADREAILDANAEYMAPAGHANPLAAKLLNEMVPEDPLGRQGDEPPPPAEDAAPPPVAVPSKGAGRQDLVGYFAAVRASIEAEIGGDADIQAWKTRNEPVYRGMPASTRRGIDVALAERRQALGLDRQAAPAEEAPQPPATLIDDGVARAQAWGAEQLAIIRGYSTGAEALQWGQDHAEDLKTMKALLPSLHDELRAAISAKVGGLA